MTEAKQSEAWRVVTRAQHLVNPSIPDMQQAADVVLDELFKMKGDYLGAREEAHRPGSLTFVFQGYEFVVHRSGAGFDVIDSDKNLHSVQVEYDPVTKAYLGGRKKTAAGQWAEERHSPAAMVLDMIASLALKRPAAGGFLDRE